MDFTDSVLRHSPWSYSKCGVLEKCVLQYHKKHVQRKRELGESSESKVGVAVHYVTECVTKEDTAPTDELLNRAVERGKLTLTEKDAMMSFVPKVEKFADWLRNFIHQNGVTETLVEHKMAINRRFEDVPFMPTRPWTPEELLVPWTGREPERPAGKPLNGEELTRAVLDGTAPVMRGLLDLGLMTRNNDLVIIDHKTGKHRNIADHAAQLNIYRLFAVARYPVRAVQCAIHYVETGRIDWTPPMTAAQVRAVIQPWLVTYLNKQHYRLQLVDGPTPPQPEVGWQCSYCGFVHECEAGRAEAILRAEKRKNKGQAPGGISI